MNCRSFFIPVILVLTLGTGCAQSKVASPVFEGPPPEKSSPADSPMPLVEPPSPVEPPSLNDSLSPVELPLENDPPMLDAPPEADDGPEMMDYFSGPDLDDRVTSETVPERSMPTETQVEEVKVREVVVLPGITPVDQRLAVYSERLSGWKALDEQISELELLERRPDNWSGCFNSIEKNYWGYSLLMEVMQKFDQPLVSSESLPVDPWELTYQDIAYLESDCEQVFMAAQSLVNGYIDRDVDDAALRSERLVGQYFGEGRYEEAIIAYQNLSSSFPEREVSFATKRMYGIALLKTGKLDAAGEVLGSILKKMEASPEERSLRRLLADLLLATGRVEKAKTQYRRLADFFESRKGDDRWVADQLSLLAGLEKSADELPLYMDVLKSYMTFDGVNIPVGMKMRVERLEEKFPESPFTFRARQMYGQTEDSARSWIASRMERVDAHLKRNEYSQAKAILELMIAGDLPVAKREIVQRTMDDALLAETRYLEEQKVLLEQSLAEMWEQAIQLLESSKFDDAIHVLTALLDTDYDLQAREKINEASEKSAAEMRRQAAGIFVKARKTSDYELKRQLYEECWRLLNDIRLKYPGVKLLGKVKQNIEILEKQIEMFDPELLRELTGVMPEEVDTAVLHDEKEY